MQVEKDHSSHFGGGMHGLPVLALQLPALVKHRREEKHPSKRSELISICKSGRMQEVAAKAKFV